MGHPRGSFTHMSGVWVGEAGVAGGWPGIYFSLSLLPLSMATLGFLIAQWS